MCRRRKKECPRYAAGREPAPQQHVLRRRRRRRGGGKCLGDGNQCAWKEDRRGSSERIYIYTGGGRYINYGTQPSTKGKDEEALVVLAAVDVVVIVATASCCALLLLDVTITRIPRESKGECMCATRFRLVGSMYEVIWYRSGVRAVERKVFK